MGLCNERYDETKLQERWYFQPNIPIMLHSAASLLLAHEGSVC